MPTTSPGPITLAATPDDVAASKAVLDRALTSLSPLLNNVPDISHLAKATAAAEATTASTPTTLAAFAGIEVSTTYVRPNGVEYRPRTMTIGAGNPPVHDVSFVRAAIRAGKPVLLSGPPGTGKTALIEAAVPNVITLQGTIETETADFVGSWVQDSDGTYRWVDGGFIVAAEEGRPYFVDEIALIDPRSLAIVYGAMDGRDEIVVTQNPKRGVVKVQPGFIVLGAYNPNVPGAVTSDALLSRFPIQMEVTTDWTLASKLGVPAKIIQVARNLNNKADSGEVTAAPQLRELLAYRDLAATFGEEFALRNFIGQIRPENRSAALAAIKSVLGSEPTALAL